ncbi:thiol:disulfide interchange protein DsbA [Pseudoduganella ginsengisoli]|uniref:Thiol:disulfide interchange protein n=1 Tax=Pseudoduganella ginsengisoli TaxID=1462440 RepID=A0A6L6PY41_9BURK|nr:thiol:disulfide interchange protein DsbA/DsbL [Pseudoduganella ginsengisoli]MTW02084.1 thioredoxin domain-containing protein [Pseudoduganella ginsengisoli]
MRVFKQLLGVAILSAAAMGAMASPQNPANGTEYVTLAAPQPVPAGKKIEVLEFFAYWCPHCNAFEPLLAEWIKKQGNNIVVRRIHVPKSDMTLPQQKLFFTLEAMGMAEQYQAKVFEAMHVQREKFTKDEQVLDWVAKNGFDRKKFTDIYRSLPVQQRVKLADQAMTDYGIDSWPMVIIDGRYKTSPQMASATLGSEPEIEYHKATIAVMDHLLAKAKAEKK